ncbi:phosphate ABC transporter phosphate-binding protein [Sutcliffiella horikoshii]|uniref:Phosphate-binding protein n=1 Tax=Sutcliffiella horikoshii TaxID=79883 RepID=A0A1Y0CPR7_9BACI|nr:MULTISPECIES: PstS family phosphate ABC transporter substrate-binding protein [Bacillaceae]ART77288.1 phosphate ABC transporter phosphate-binding protein [Sutcliffiella horikoshii]TYS74175.1 PstS family phosphate ABC transporter substrate-binding protein [Sutcliffiella horikoshii]
MKSFKRFLLLAIVASLAVFAAACGNANNNGGNEGTSEGASAEGGEELEGSVVIDGSGTVFPFMSVMAEKYMTEAQEGVSVEVSRAGTSAGFKKFLVEDGTDFNDASRAIKDEEKAQAEELGIDVKELKVALDGLTIVINKENDWATELTEQEIIDIFLAEGGKKNWSDVRPEFPDEPIKTYGPNENHGTYEFFWEVILEEKDLAEGTNLQQEYSTLVDLVSKDKNAIGFFGYGYYESNQDKLTAVNVDFGNGPVAPSLDTIAEDGDYAGFTRPVFTYLNTNMAKEKPQVLDYAIYTMKNAQAVAADTGFAPLTDEQINTYVEELEGLK